MRFIKSIYISIILILLFGCQKKEEKSYSSEGEWVLVDASLYIKRWGNYPLIKYDHFSPTKNYSNLDLHGSEFQLDQIIKNETKWTLPKENAFILNDTTVYEIQSNAYSFRAYPIENGSSRVFLLNCINEDYTEWLTSEREQAATINGITDNYTYYSKLLFKRVGSNSITPPLCREPATSTYMGVLQGTLMKNNILKGQKWVVYKYKMEGFNSYETISDTMTFLTNSKYYYETKQQQLNYAIYDMESYYSLVLNHTRFGAQITSSDISKFAIENGDVQNAVFTNNTVGAKGEKLILFFRRIQ
jgi:hypothetical protein